MNVEKVFQVDAKSTDSFLNNPGLGLYIPAYQRAYSWSQENVERYVQDLLQGVVRCEHAEDTVTFLGTLIQVTDPRPASVHPKVQGDLPKGVTLVIDGQQRLTTILLGNLLLREELKRAEGGLGGSIEAEEEAWLKKRTIRLKQTLLDTLFLRMKGGDKEFELYPRMIRAHDDTWSTSQVSARYKSPIASLLHDYVKHANDAEKDARYFKPHADKNLKKAFPEFYNAIASLMKLMKAIRINDVSHITELEDFNEAVKKPQVRKRLLGDDSPAFNSATDQLLRLLILGMYLLDRVCVTSVSVTQEDYAFDMFEALNTTGEPLTAYETLRPRVIEAESLDRYGTSESKRHMDVIDAYFSAKNQPRRRKDTARMVTSFALAESGEKRGRHLSEQRRYLRESYQKALDLDAKVAYIEHFRYLVEFVDALWEPEDVGNAWNHPLVANSCEAALALRVLADATHEITIAPLARWYSSWIKQSECHAAAEDFQRVARGLSAFFAIWRLTRMSTANVDSLVRRLVKEGYAATNTPPLFRQAVGNSHPTPGSFLAALRHILESEGLGESAGFSARVAQMPVYSLAKAHTRLMLLMASHDAVPDPEAPGLLKAGVKGVQPMLNRDRWEETAQTVEHIAPQRPAPSSVWDGKIYDTAGAMHRLGNLTVLPISLNATIGNQGWKKKQAFYSMLCAGTIEDVEKLKAVAEQQGITVPSDFPERSTYQVQVQALSSVQEWTLRQIEQRSLRLGELAWRHLSRWLEW